MLVQLKLDFKIHVNWKFLEVRPMHLDNADENKFTLACRVRPIYQLADIIGQYWAVADVSVSAYGTPACADIKTVFKAGKNSWTSD